LPQAANAENSGARNVAGTGPENVDAKNSELVGKSAGKSERGCDTPLSAQTDQQLLLGLRTGSEPHFSELYNRYFQRIYSFVYSRIRNHADAEEVVQETFTAVFRSFESYRGTSSLLSWIYGIAKNTLNNNLRRAKNEGQRLENLSPDVIRPPSALSDCNPEEHLNMRRYTETIRDRLESVSSWQTEIFAMRHLENLSIQEIEARTHRSSDAIRSSLYRVKRLLFDAAELSPARAPRSSPAPRTSSCDDAGEQATVRGA